MNRSIRTKIPPIAASAFALLAAAACSDSAAPPASPPDTSIISYTYEIAHTFPHDENAYTQGLVYVDSVLVEGTGWYRYYRASTLRRSEIETGDVLQIRNMPDTGFFGEGVAVWGDTIVQLTWKDSVAVMYDRESFDEIGRFRYPTQGWGLTHDGKRFIMSDGTATLYFRDRYSFAEIGRVTVTDTSGPVPLLNELEYIGDRVYANIFQKDWIAIIDPATGRLTGTIDLTGMEIPRRGVPNGIAYDADNDRLFVTGKLWRHLYQIDLVRKP
jgi:glutamine cyclotransferase